MVWSELTEALEQAMRAAGWWTPERAARIELAIPRDPAHGDWTTNLALGLAREVRQPPRTVAERLAGAMPLDPARFAPVEIAGPGFLNVRYAPELLRALPGTIAREGEAFGRHDHAGGTQVLVEYVSANPTGPLNVVNARAAAVGATLVRLLAATGHVAAGEFYVNDTGSQVDALGESVLARMAERLGLDHPFPENGYQGEYIRQIAAELEPRHGEAARRTLAERAGGAAPTGGRSPLTGDVLDAMVARQRRDLADYGAEFARWFRESELHDDGSVTRTLEELRGRGVLFESEGATWLRTTGFGDDKDRVVVRSNGRPTYLLPDIAYHRDKRARGFRHSIDLWGPDHHGHILPLEASLQALGVEPDFLEVLIVQQVNLLSGGQPVKMSKRAGEFITLRDLMDEVGPDCAKFFFLMRSTNAHLDFDLDLAKQQNDENPAYYVQYAHARVRSVLRFAAERGLVPAATAGALDTDEEVLLVRKLATFPEVVRGAAFAREPHRISAYLLETAAAFHRFYHRCRVVTDDAARSRERLLLVQAARTVLANGLALMGVAAPERMERESEPVA